MISGNVGQGDQPSRSVDGASAVVEGSSPVKATVTVQLAVAIAISTNAPVRLGNLVQIRLDKKNLDQARRARGSIHAGVPRL